MTRMLAEHLSEQWGGQAVVVDNRGGGNTLIGAQAVANAKADGYTLLFTTENTLVVNQSLYKKLPYDPVKDFEPISQVFQANLALMVNPSVPVSSLKDLIALAKRSPGALSYSSTGSGTPTHLNMELFKRDVGIDIKHIPYKGGAESMNAVLSGEVTMALIGFQQTQPLYKAGKVKVLAIGGNRRSPAMPEVPTFSEMTSFEFMPLWMGLVAPAGTPKEVVDQIQRDVVKAINLTVVQGRLAQIGYESIGSTPAQFSTFMAAERVRWGRAVKESDARID